MQQRSAPDIPIPPPDTPAVSLDDCCDRTTVRYPKLKYNKQKNRDGELPPLSADLLEMAKYGGPAPVSQEKEPPDLFEKFSKSPDERLLSTIVYIAVKRGRRDIAEAVYAIVDDLDIKGSVQRLNDACDALIEDPSRDCLVILRDSPKILAIHDELRMLLQELICFNQVRVVPASIPVILNGTPQTAAYEKRFASEVAENTYSTSFLRRSVELFKAHSRVLSKGFWKRLGFGDRRNEPRAVPQEV